MKTNIIIVLLLAFVGPFAFGQGLTLDQALSRALSSNPEIKAAVAQAQAQHSAIKARYSLDNPTLGFMREQNMNFMEQQMGPMQVWSVSQKIKFPTKYWLSGDVQKSRAVTADAKLSQTRLEVRQRLINAYFNLFAIEKIISLIKAQRETLREVARTAESRHAVGAVPQQDEMKAHEEQTKIATDLIMAKEERATVQANLDAIIDKRYGDSIQLQKGELQAPTFKVSPAEILKIARAQSQQLKVAQDFSKSADLAKSLAGWQYAPDFTVSYKQAYGSKLNAYSVGVGITIPLWFFAKQTGDFEAASARAIAAKENLQDAKLITESKVQSLAFAVKSQDQLLKIYKTSLIPQAMSALDSSLTAYRAGRTKFIDLLDSERSLYSVRIAFYRTLSQYVGSLTQLETLAGASLSSLPMKGFSR